MRIKVLGRLICLAGAIGLIASLVWWQTFYTDIFRFLGSHNPIPSECLYSFGGPCGMVSGTAAMLGAVAYDPKAFWVSAALFILGLFLMQTPEQYTDEFGQSKSKNIRRDPTL